MKQSSYSVTALSGMPLVAAGDDLCALVLSALAASGMALAVGDVVVVAQKVVSKAEGREVSLDTVTASPEARELAARTGKDPALAELILSEAEDVVRTRPNLVIVRNRHGLVLANAGIDQSNVAPGQALLLPVDPDASAATLRRRRLVSVPSRRSLRVALAAWRRALDPHHIRARQQRSAGAGPTDGALGNGER